MAPKLLTDLPADVVQHIVATSHVLCVAGGRWPRITGSRDEIVKVWRDGVCERTIQVASRVWSVATKSLEHLQGTPTTFAWWQKMPDGQRILSGGNDGTSACGSSTAPSRTRLAAHRHGERLRRCPTTGTRSGLFDTVKLFNVNGGAVLRTFNTYTRSARSLALLPDGLRFVSGGTTTSPIAYHGLAP